jgi:hypothetical protein
MGKLTRCALPQHTVCQGKLARGTRFLDALERRCRAVAGFFYPRPER